MMRHVESRSRQPREEGEEQKAAAGQVSSSSSSSSQKQQQQKQSATRLSPEQAGSHMGGKGNLYFH